MSFFLVQEINNCKVASVASASDIDRSSRRKKSPDERKPKVPFKQIEQKFICNICGKVFSLKGRLRQHMWVHTVNKVECTECGKEFQNKVRLRYHIRHTHEKVTCEYCGKLYTDNFQCMVHVERVHKRNEVVECNICGNKLSSKASLKVSALYSFLIQVSKVCFFQIHLITHSKRKCFECDICKKKFTTKEGLVRHVRIHMGEKPFKCRFCHVGFRTPYTMQHHERLHTGETPYHCPLCDKKYAQLSNLKVHFKNNHKGRVFRDVYKRSEKLRPLSNFT
jgi:KRAB domain-containing zinc finger protein